MKKMFKVFILILLAILAINPLGYAEVTPIHYIKHERAIFLDSPSYLYYIDAIQIFVLSNGEVTLKLDDEYGILNATLNNETIEISDDGFLRLGTLKKGIYDVTIEAAAPYTANIATTIADEGIVDTVYMKLLYNDIRYNLTYYEPKASLYMFRNYMMWYYVNVDNMTFTAKFDDLYKPPVVEKETPKKGNDYRLYLIGAIVVLGGALFVLTTYEKKSKLKTKAKKKNKRKMK